jgi:streptogramin lyase
MRQLPSVLILLASLSVPAIVDAAAVSGRVIDSEGGPVTGAMVTFRFGSPFQERTVFTGSDGRYTMDGLPDGGQNIVRVRRIGWHDVRLSDQTIDPDGAPFANITMRRHTDPALVAAQLPANHWYALVLQRIDNEEHREQLVRQCTYCHQQGNTATRLQREPEEWAKVLALMARMGGGLDKDLREQVPTLFNEAYDPATAIPALTQGFGEPGFSPPPPADVRRAVIDEFELGGRSSMQHDMIVHPSGHIYSVDMTTDSLYRLDPSVPGGSREQFAIPREGVPLGGIYGGNSSVMPPNSDMHVGPHSLQVGPDGDVWITLATGNRLARFDPKEKGFTLEELPAGFYPHTLRLDDQGRIWYTIAVSNHVGMYDPSSGRHEVIRVPARSFGEEVMLRLLPTFLWLGQYFELSATGAAEGASVPVPYGIDIAPDGGIWFSQLNAHRIGHIDPDTLEIRMIDTPFTAPRRMRFDSKGRLWIPGFSSNLVSRFDPATEEFVSYELPIEPLGTETPYALNVDLNTDEVWICGTNSDTLIRFEPEAERFTIYPLPTQVTYTREIDFDNVGGIWTSNSNAPAWQIETGVPRIVRLDPTGRAMEETGATAAVASGR